MDASMMYGAAFWIGIGLTLQCLVAYTACKYDGSRFLAIFLSFVPVPGTLMFPLSLVCWIPHGLAFIIIHTMLGIATK